ncbi:MAG: CehA/McbA family metallohydrolase, partial [bacterium]
MKKIKKLLVPVSFLLALFSAVGFAGEYNLYFGGTHSHTSFSDGKKMPEDAWDTARGGGCDFWYVTDHYHSLSDVESHPEGSQGVKEWDYEMEVAGKKTEDGKFLALLGWEWSDGDFGHMNVLFDPAEPPPMLMTGVYDRFISYWLRKHRDSLTGFNHPLWSEGKGMNNFRDFEFVPKIAQQVVYMEISFLDEVHYFYRALDRGWRIAPLAAQDNHDPDWCLRGELVGVYAEELTGESLKEAFIARRFYATTDRGLILSFRGNGEEMGSLVAADSVELEIGVSHREQKTPKLVRLVTNGAEVLKEWEPEPGEFNASYRVDVEGE